MFFFLVWTISLLLASPTNLPLTNRTHKQADSTFFVKLDTAHQRVLRKYIREHKRYGLQKDTTILFLSISNPFNNPDYHEAQIGASGSQDVYVLSREVPAYLSEIDGYSVAVFFSSYQTCTGVIYPKAYLEKVHQLRAKLRRKKWDVYPYERFQNWKVIFRKGKAPEIKILV